MEQSAENDVFPDQPPGVRSLEPGHPFSLPPVAAAAERVAHFIRWFGDGIVFDSNLAEDAGWMDPDDCPTLYARDLEALCRVLPSTPEPGEDR